MLCYCDTVYRIDARNYRCVIRIAFRRSVHICYALFFLSHYLWYDNLLEALKWRASAVVEMKKEKILQDDFFMFIQFKHIMVALTS